MDTGPRLGFPFMLLTIFFISQLSFAVKGCSPDSLAVYSLSLTTHWTPSVFPKQYPRWRPPAQWSKLYGISHDGGERLWAEGKMASEGIAEFAETGNSDKLEAESAKRPGVYDEFRSPHIANGSGSAEADFFVDGNHTKVSAIVKIVPSPDWFIGLDGVDLCKNGNWIESLTIKAQPMDAGSDSGFTFTSPNWKTDPKETIKMITSKYPNHDANSFFYPEYRTLPTIAVFHIAQEKLYHLEKSDFPKATSKVNLIIQESVTDGISNEVTPIHTARIQEKKKNPKRKERRHRKKRPMPCRVSEWSDWSACSDSCGIGQKQRVRKVVRHARLGGHPCPPLLEVARCSRNLNCTLNHFSWS